MEIMKLKVRSVARTRMGRVVSRMGLFSILVLGLVVLSFQPSPSAQIQRTIMPVAPRITSFKINNGAPSTTNPIVTLNNTVEGQVTEYRVSSRLEYLESANWKPYSNAPSFEFDPDDMQPEWLADSTKVFHCQAFFQVRLVPLRQPLVKLQSFVSLQVADSIDFIVPAREHKVYVGDAIQFAGNEGYTNSGKAADPNSDCALHANFGSTLILQTFGKPIPLIGGTFGAKADFTLFGGRTLNPRWKFKRISLNDTSCNGLNGQKNGYSKLTWPQSDSQNITIKIHTWCEGNHICELVFDTLYLWGPGDGNWKDAFSYIH